MASTYVNDLRLNEMATGDASGTWGTTTNTNLELIAEAFSYGTEAITTNADTHTTTIADGATDPGRSMFLKYTGALDSACTVTIGPNTVSKLWFIENATTGSQNLVISQGTGANITIPAGDTKIIYADGAGAGGAMVDALASISAVDLKVQDDLTISDDLTFDSDSAVITFGADGDTTLTHTDGTGLTLNSTNKICFNDASQFIQGSSATVLSLGATDEIDLTATAIDINGTVDMSSTLTLAGNADFNGDLDVDGTTNLDVVDIDGAVDMASTLAVTGIVTLTDDLIIGDGKTIGSASDVDAMTIASNGQVTFTQTLIGTDLDISGDVDIDGTLETDNLTIGSAQGSDGQVLTSTGSGVAWEDAAGGASSINDLSDAKTFGTSSIMLGDATTGTISGANYNTAVGIDVFEALTTGDKNTALGFGALTGVTTGNNMVAIGYNALSTASTVEDNVAVGTEALASTNNTRNLGVGYRALTAQSGSSDNIAIGYDALVRQTTGANGNLAIGNYAGRAVVSSASTSQLIAIGHTVASNASAALAGYQNTFIGYNVASGASLAGAFQNTAVGGSTLTDLTIGDHNVAMGYNAGNSITTGGENVFIGSACGEDITTGSQNVAIGRESFMDATTASDCVAVGFQALENATGGSNTSIGYKAGEDVTGGTNNFFVGKGTGVSGSPGGSITTGNNEGVLGNGDVSKINVQVSLTVASDERDKTDFQPLTAGLDFVNALTPYTYYWDKRANYVDWDANPDTDLNSVTHDGTHKEDWMDLGFKAQDVVALEESINHKLSNKTNLVSNQTGDGKQYQLQYEKFVPILVKALQEADDKIDALTARVTALES
jgi:hypothetical protein